MERKSTDADREGYVEDPWEDNPVMGEAVSPDFLPDQEALSRAVREKRYRVHVPVTSDIYEYFEKEAEKMNVPSSQIIHTILNDYITTHRQ